MTVTNPWYDGFVNGLLYAQAQFPGKDHLHSDVLVITAPTDDTFGPPNPEVDSNKPQPAYCLPFEPKKMWEALDLIEDECRCSSLRITKQVFSPSSTLWWRIEVASSEGLGYPENFEDNRKDWT
jgi:hypothetical protein